jgi:regulator of protease activity HflC (stomatin/prohibitin superfamily)
MKKVLLILLAGFLLVGLQACEVRKVTAGNVGVKVYLLGGEKGVESEEVGVGRYWLSVNEDLFIFPTFTQNYTWTKDATEGSPNDESISFGTLEGMSVNSDIGITYRIDPEMVHNVFQKYKRGVDEITDTFLRNMVRDSLVEEASTRPIESIYGIGKKDLMDAVEASVKAQVQDIGIIVEKVYWIGKLWLPPSVNESINMKLEANQKAQMRRNEVAEAAAAADKKIEEARGQAESVLLVAKADADAINMKGDALRSNPEILELSAIEKWNGVLPVYMTNGAPVPFVDVGSSKP